LKKCWARSRAGSLPQNAAVPDLTRRLARLRVPLGFLCAVVVLVLAQPTARSLLWGSLVAAIGELLRIWAAGHLNKSREVTSSGPYRWIGHPLYAGSSIMGIGLAIAANSLLVAAIIGLYLMTTIAAAIRSEEAFLRGKFGDQYERYRRAGPDHRSGEGRRRFSLQQAIANREHRALAGLVVAVLLLVLKATYNGLFWRTGAGHQ
jgi:protein-S-isoprenylcysteine O-methyltransferase Ste14